MRLADLCVGAGDASAFALAKLPDRSIPVRAAVALQAAAVVDVRVVADITLASAPPAGLPDQFIAAASREGVLVGQKLRFSSHGCHLSHSLDSLSRSGLGV